MFIYFNNNKSHSYTAKEQCQFQGMCSAQKNNKPALIKPQPQVNYINNYYVLIICMHYILLCLLI